MTTVLVLEHSPRRVRVEGILRWAVLVCLVFGLTANAQERPVHWLNAGALPPGAIGSQRLHRGGPLSGYFQPVRIRAPQGARISLAEEGGFCSVQSNDVMVGLEVGQVYRLQVSDIPNSEGLELYPTIELVDRTYPPPGLALRFPIPIELTQDELDLAAKGAFVTRVIYIEDPAQALSISRKANDEQPWVEAAPGEDPFIAADRQGRPVAILRIGARVPSTMGAQVVPVAPRFITFDPAEVAAAQERCCEVPIHTASGGDASTTNSMPPGVWNGAQPADGGALPQALPMQQLPTTPQSQQ